MGNSAPPSGLMLALCFWRVQPRRLRRGSFCLLKPNESWTMLSCLGRAKKPADISKSCMLVLVRDNLTQPIRVRQIGEIWAVEGRAVARVAALKLHRARTVA